MTYSEIVPTHNRCGWTSSVPNQITVALLQWLTTLEATRPLVLDIGAGLGVATVPLLDAGADVVALDIEESHLSSIQEEAKRRSTVDRLSVVAGRFPDSVHFEKLDAIHCSNVLHFLPGVEIEIGALRMYEWLKPSGRVFIQVGTIYAGHIQRLLLQFEQRRQTGVKWAGETSCARDFVASEFASVTPTFMNYLDAEPLIITFKDAGFLIEQAWYYTRTGCPSSVRNDGREHFGCIASKPKFGEIAAACPKREC